MKTMMQNKFYKLAALLLIAVMCFGIVAPYVAESYMAEPDEDVISIGTAEELVELSKNCAYDKWSVGKTVVLSNDISLKDVEFEPIPYFAGTFDGQGYTISDLELNGNYYPAGLFGVTRQGAMIKNLNVIGSVMPEGSRESVGGIVGINGGTLLNVSFSGVVSGEVAVGGITGLNKETGIIESAFVQGNIFGEHGTGGVAGRNLGKIFSGKNESYVNNASVDSTISLKDIDTNILQSLYSLNSSDMMNTFTDTGGIAGYSSGMILKSKNEGTIGYPHVGYNAGGIVGRNTGYIQGCTNDGEVLGRKDIGGIVGQVEPFLDVEVDISDLSILEGQLNNLKNQVDATSADAKNTVDGVKENLDNITEYIKRASDAVKKLGSYNDSTNNSGSTGTSGIQIPQDLELPDNIEIPEDIKLPDNIELPEDIERPDNIELPENIELPDNIELPEDIERPDNIKLPEDIELPQIDINYDSIKETLGILSDSLNGISSELRKANNNAKDGSNEVLDGLESINSQMNVVSDTIVGMIEETKDFTIEDIIADTSNIDISAVTYGKVADCTNKGTINGDLNSGGIVGIMSVEYELDPEDDVTADISWEERKKYEVKAILINCTNKGEVIAKKDCAGAICGQMDIGVITNCYAYGTAKSESGNYVGGIAGIARAVIANCVANCELSGNNYVGGIIGMGYTAEDGGSGISNCYSLVKITDCKQFEGAVAGCDEGSFANNYFVSNKLQGINRVSYEGIAQPITYEELLQVAGIPDELKEFTLSFVAEGKTIKSQNFNYGDSFGADIFPEVPKKEGYDGQWDITDLTNLCFDTIVTAEYTSYVTVLQSEMLRENHRPVLLVEGDFSGGDIVTLDAVDITSEMQSKLKMAGKVLESWKICFSDDGKKRHSIRFLPAENMENTKLYVKEDGKWNRVETTEIGSYIAFQVAGNEIELAVISKGMEMLLLIGGIVLIIILIVACILLEQKKHLFSSCFKKLKDKFGIKKLVIFFIVLGSVLSLIGIIYIAMMPKMRISTELAALSADILTAENQSMNLELTADVGSNHIELDSKVYILKEEASSVFALEENGHTIYLSGEVVYLENGKAFHMGEARTSDNSLLEQVQKLFKATEITRTTEQDQVIYSITTTGEDAKNVLAILVPSTEGQLASAGDTEIRIIASDGILQRVEVKGSAALKDSMETAIEVSAALFDFSELEKGEYQIPEVVSAAIKNTESASLPVMGEEMYRLLLAWIEFSKNKQSGTVVFDVECGPINLEAEYDWADVLKNIAGISNASNIEALPDLVYQICMDGEFTCEKLGESYIFRMTLDKDAIMNLAEMIAPEIKTQVVNLTNGAVEVVVENNEIASFEIEIDGTVTVIFSEVDASVGAEFVFNLGNCR